MLQWKCVMNRNKLITTLALTTAVSAAIMMITVAWQTGYNTGFTRGTSATQTQKTSAAVVFIVGKVTGITGTTVTVESFISGSPKPVSLHINTNARTAFEQMIKKDIKVYQTEQTAFNTKLTAARAQGTASPFGPVPPVPFTLQKSSLTDLRVGNAVSVTATQDTSAASTFSATKVLFDPTPPTSR